jgi:D-amino-acid dehydrogenase
MSIDDVPLIGRVPGRDGQWIATGHGMMGVSMSAATGQLIANLVSGKAPAVDPAPYSPARFA